MEDENTNELESNEVDLETISQIAKILSDILDSIVAEPIPSTSNKSSVQLSDVVRKSYSENISQSLSPALSVKLQGHALNYNLTETNRRDDRTEHILFETCTLKEMLNEILDCGVIRRPSQLPSISSSQISEGDLEEPPLPNSFDAPPDYFLDPRVIPRQIYSIRNDIDEGTSSRMQATVKEVLNEILDYTVFKKSLHSSSCRAMFSDFSRPGPSQRLPDYIPHQREFLGNHEFQIYRSMGAGIINSSNAVHGETYLQMPITKSLNRILPTYSTVLRLGPPKLKPVYSSPSFIPKVPPPSYAEVEGLWEDGPSVISSESVVFGPDPAYMVCPRCRTVVVTDVETQRSNFTHLVALVMCLFLCWPCCLLPYCLRSCNYTYHTCPNCRYYFGMYRPF